MPEADKCPQCGTPLSPGALTGLCPACLLKAGAADDTVTDAKLPPFNPPTVGELAAKFPQLEILELIGKGGMGAVYKARQKQLDRLVALKILPPGIGNDPAFAERFTREARALAQLNHPNIVTLYEFGETNGQYYFLMEFVDGVNLRQLLHTSRISAREALAIVPQICDALQFAHDHGIVHRDIKPENILLDRRGRVKVADFGLAKIIVAAVRDPRASPLSESERPSAGTENLTDAGKVMGTPSYMSPEQKENPGEVDHRADIYALGVVFYQMLTGELPGKRIEPPSKKVQIDVRLDEIVLRALEKKPELRFQQASVMKTQVETISAETDKSDIHHPKSGVKSPPSRRTMLLVVWIAIIVALVVLFIIKNHHSIPPTTLSQSEFLEMFQSNQIAHARIDMSGQSSQLTPISGAYYQTDKDGKLTREEIPFVAPNVLLTQKMLDELLPSDRIDTSTHNAMLMSVIWGVAPFIFWGIIFLLIPGIIIYVIWRAMRKRTADTVPPLIQKPDRFWRWFLVIALAMIIVVFLIAILGLIAAVVIPNFVKGRERAQALQLQQMEAMAQTEASTNFFIGQTYFPNGDSINITSVERTGNGMSVKGHYNLVSTNEATLSFNVMATADHPAPPGWPVQPAHPPQTLHISRGQGEFDLSRLHRQPGSPHISMYANGHSFAAIYFGAKDEAAAEGKLDLTDRSDLDFGPTIEQVIPDSKDPTTLTYVNFQGATNTLMLINYDSGVLIIGAAENWARNKGGLPGIDSLQKDDPFSVASNPKVRGFGILDMAVSPIYGENNWDEIEATKVVKEFSNQLSDGLPETGMTLFSDNKFNDLPFPALWLFLTHDDHNMGMLQVIGFTENPRGVKIRYKLVRKITEAPAEAPVLASQPPVVVETFPLSGAREVEPGETEIRVRFSKEMTDDSWSWSTAWENSTPKFIGSPHYAADGKTCVARVKLEPDRTYAFWLNSDNFQNFKDRDGRPAVPYLLIFQTKYQ